MERCCGQAAMVHADHVSSWWGVELLIHLLIHTKYFYFCVKSMCQPMPTLLPTRGKSFIQDNGKAFMSPHLMPLASLLGTETSPLVQLGGIPYGQRAALLAAIYGLGGTLCGPGGSTLCTPAPHDTTFMEHCRSHLEKDISGFCQCHRVRLATLHPPFIVGGCFGSSSSSSLS